MSKLKLKRGDGEISLDKIPDYFAIRMKQGSANNARALHSQCGKTAACVEHVDTAETAKMDIFSVDDETALEPTMKQLRAAPGSDVVTHMYRLDDDQQAAVMPTGLMTIQFAADFSKEDRETLLAGYGLEIIEDIDFLPHAYSVKLTPSSPMNPLKMAAELQQISGVVAAEPDLSFKVALQHIPNDSLYQSQWHLNNRGHLTGLKQGADVSAESAWEFTRGSREVRICVIDDGFDLSHPDLSAAGKIVSPRDFNQNDFDPLPAQASDNHGTACAGVALAEENDSGVVGLAPRCAFMPMKMHGWLSDQAIVDMFQYVIDEGADVVSCSWSASSWNFPLSIKMNGIIHKAATQGRNGKGCVILFAAGNENRPLKGVKDNRTSHQGFALHPDVIAVAASNSLDLRSGYSNFGPEIDVCAPSSGSPGRGVVTTDRRSAAGYSSSDYTHSFGGTSSATPLVAGLAGLILSLDANLSAAQVREIIMLTADQIDNANGNYQDGHSPLYGAGRINAEKALAMVAGDKEAERMPGTLFMEHRINRPIPDMGQLLDDITFPLDVGIKQFEVNIDIKHTWRDDLQVILTSPGGNQVTLFDRSGGSDDDIVASLRSSDEPELFAELIGQPAAGTWQLQVADLANQDVGVLKSWGIAVTY
jgi:subtilisin family serine protease